MLPLGTYELIEDDIRVDFENFPKTIPLYQQAYENYPSLSKTDVFQTLEQLLKEYQ